ncbi:MAG: DUF7151 family protein, partial [Myxococcota bacterium]
MRFVVGFCGLLVMTGCGQAISDLVSARENGSANASGNSNGNADRGGVLVNVFAASVGACPMGGVNVESGPDRNGDGQLADDEVTKIIAVCNGESGAEALVDVEVEPPGDACPDGGVRIRSGHDRDGDGELGEQEVSRVERVCHGSAGRDGLLSLIALFEVGPGDTCAGGGVRIETGLDIDGDHVLSPGEVTQSAVLCHGVPGADGTSCTVERDDVRGTVTILCEDGTAATLEDGEDGAPGLDGVSCTLVDNGDGTRTLQCNDGTSAVIRDGADGADGTDGAPGTDGADGHSSLVLVDGNVGSACVKYGNGGRRIRTGLDNGDGGGTANDGVLSDGEVDSTSYVCNGSDGDTPTVTAFGAGDEGVNCKFSGGIKVQVESNAPFYLCHGAMGATGAAGADGVTPTVVAFAAGDEGTNCDVTGGIKVQVGDNAPLYVCNGLTGATGAAGADGLTPSITAFAAGDEGTN